MVCFLCRIFGSRRRNPHPPSPFVYWMVISTMVWHEYANISAWLGYWLWYFCSRCGSLQLCADIFCWPLLRNSLCRVDALQILGKFAIYYKSVSRRWRIAETCVCLMEHNFCWWLYADTHIGNFQCLKDHFTLYILPNCNHTMQWRTLILQCTHSGES